MVAKGFGIAEVIVFEVVGGGLDVLGVETLTVFIEDIEMDFCICAYILPSGEKVAIREGCDNGLSLIAYGLLVK